ncbi:MAG: hypothetical protein JF614_26450 [Acidobacteria bacterium]|nr:hypothetical protein [Acidobacteriota bacterium]
MKKTAKDLRLKLSRETLHYLDSSELGTVEGAATNVRSVCGSCASCFVFQTRCVP